MPDEHNCIEHHAIINDVSYTLQSRTVELDNGERHREYRVLLNDAEVKTWTRGDILPYFDLTRS